MDRVESPTSRRGLRVLIAFLVLLIAAPAFPSFLWDVPGKLIAPLSAWVGAGLNWFARDAAIGGVTVAEITRAIAAGAETPIDWLTDIHQWLICNWPNWRCCTPPANGPSSAPLHSAHRRSFCSLE